jgi:hypothetical protein
MRQALALGDKHGSAPVGRDSEVCATATPPSRNNTQLPDAILDRTLRQGAEA